MGQTIAVGTSMAGSAGLRLLCIPELVYSISRHLQRADLARLAQTCRGTFYIVCPAIWQDLDGAGNLLGLVKSASLQYVANKMNLSEILLGSKAWYGRLEEVVLSEEPGSNRFERFDYYALFVQSLKVYPQDRCFFSVSGWQLLTAHAHSRPLLPNLRKLSIAAVDICAGLANVPIWIKLLGNQNLTEVAWCINDSWPDGIWAFTQPATCEILDHLVSSSPNIQKLSLGPRHPSEQDDYHYWLTNQSPPPELWHHRLQELPRLRHVSITHGWISRSSITALGSLPALESLEIYDGDFGSHLYARRLNEMCSPTAFPALHHLSLCRPSPYDNNAIFEFRRLSERITELEVHIMDGDDGRGWVARGEPSEWGIFSSLSKAPRLESLLITSLDQEARTAPLKNRGSFDAMAQLPLKKIDIGGISLGKAPFAFDLGVIWLNVTELILPCQTASLQELAYFAAMPLLARLVVQLDFTTASIPANIPNAHAGLTILESAQWGKLNPAPEIIEHHVRILHLLWPRLCEVRWASHYWAYSAEALVFNQILSLRAAAACRGLGDLPDVNSSLAALYDKLREYWQKKSDVQEEDQGSGYEFISDDGHE